MQSYLLKTAIALATATAVSSCSPSDSAKSGISEPLSQTATTSNSTTRSSTTSSSTNSSRTIGKDKHGMPTYSDSSRSRYVRATAYSHMEKEIGAPGRKNAAGTTLLFGSVRSAAADWSRLPLGTKFRVKGTSGVTYIVDDYGSALVGTNTVDFFFPSLRQMNRWGTRKVNIEIIKMGSFERSAKLLKGRRHAAHCRKMYYAILPKLNANKYASN